MNPDGKMRLVLVLGKFPCVKLDRMIVGWKATLDLNGRTMEISIPYEFVDVRVGDKLTLYTEVLAHEKPRINSQINNEGE